MVSAIILQGGSSTWIVILVAACGIAAFLLVALWRLLPLMHKPRVVMRFADKPVQYGGTWVSSGPSNPVGAPASAPIGMQSTDRTELLQAKSQWERLIEEARANEHLAPDQRESFVEEGQRRISEINKQLTELG